MGHPIGPEQGVLMDATIEKVGHKTKRSRTATTAHQLGQSDSERTYCSWRLWVAQVQDLYLGRFYLGWQIHDKLDEETESGHAFRNEGTCSWTSEVRNRAGNVNWIAWDPRIDRGVGRQISYGHPPQAKAGEGLGLTPFFAKTQKKVW